MPRACNPIIGGIVACILGGLTVLSTDAMARVQASSASASRQSQIRCDGSDETAQWRKLLAMTKSGQVITLPVGKTCVYSTIIVPDNVTIDGGNRNATVLMTNSPVADGITLGDGSVLRNVKLTSSVPRTGGYFVRTAANGTVVENIVCARYFICYGAIGAKAELRAIAPVLRNVLAFNPAIGRGAGFAVFHNFGNAQVASLSVSGPGGGQQPDFGLKFLNGDTASVSDVNITQHGAALDLAVPAHNNLYALHVQNSLFDSAGKVSGAFNAPSCWLRPGGGLYETVMTNVWCGLSAGSDGMLIAPRPPGVIEGLHIHNGQFSGNRGNGVHIATSGLSDFTFTGGSAGGNNGSGVLVDASCRFGVISGMMLRKNHRGDNGDHGMDVRAGADLTFRSNFYSGAKGAYRVQPGLKAVIVQP
ncbi:hypothetical protein WG907_12820 [Sphingobium sp. AN558]|uniref:hypothetical protein n=1 Tax=Sphingobium sp. AN558 TaxID=3133442 RepID=UPI0030C3681F